MTTSSVPKPEKRKAFESEGYGGGHSFVKDHCTALECWSSSTNPLLSNSTSRGDFPRRSSLSTISHFA